MVHETEVIVVITDVHLVLQDDTKVNNKADKGKTKKEVKTVKRGRGRPRKYKERGNCVY